jgi:monoamine oxidase
MDCEIGIIGAGVAGLAAASVLSRAGIEVRCLEATDHIGGRVLTVHDASAPVPIELGAEFVHGLSPDTWELIRSRDLTVFEHTSRTLHFDRGRILDNAGPDGIAARVLDGMAKSRGSKDQTFEQLLRHSRQSDEVKDWARIFVEGFNAARSDSIGVRSLISEDKAADKIQGDRTFRILQGYDSIPVMLLQSIVNAECVVLLDTVVESVKWQRGQVEIECKSAIDQQATMLRCRQLIVTVPLGVLQAKAIRFDPEPRENLAAAAALRFGQAYRLTMRFRDVFWEEDPQLRGAGFLISKEKHFPTWWTTHPVVSPLLTAWMAGTAAEEFEAGRPDDIVREALTSLSRILRRKIPEPEAYYFHDWRTDPFVRGAYSYAPAGKFGAHAAMAKPQQGTLFFAGEAANVKGHAGTVHGAIESGRRAAEMALSLGSGAHHSWRSADTGSRRAARRAGM